MMTTKLAPLLEAFFTNRLQQQRRVSSNTVGAYRDTFRLLLRFAYEKLKRPPSELLLGDLDAKLVGEFLQYLEENRGNSIRTRNARLAAIRSFFRYVALEEPAHSFLCQRVLSICQKKYEKNIVSFLDQKEINALLAAPEQDTWLGRRDHALMLLACQTGLRVSEITHLQRQDVELGTGPHVRCRGKGRKQRCTPLTKTAVNILKAWFREAGQAPADPVFPSRRGGYLSRDAVEQLIKKHVAKAEKSAPSLKAKRVSPHVLRHTAAMILLQSGVDLSVIALWLGHESVETTQIYIHADLTIKERALARTCTIDSKPVRFKPPDNLLHFLQGL